MKLLTKEITKLLNNKFTILGKSHENGGIKLDKREPQFNHFEQGIDYIRQSAAVKFDKALDVSVIKENAPKVVFDKYPRFFDEKKKHEHRMFLIDYDHNVKSYGAEDRR